jgi:hypothetical protein
MPIPNYLRLFGFFTFSVILAATGACALAATVSVNPVTAMQGQNITIVLSGQGTHWAAGRTRASGGPGITTGIVTVNSPFLAAVPVELGTGAAVGLHTITVTTGTETVSADLQVTPGVAEIALISPNVILPGRTTKVTIQGRFTSFVPGSTVDMGPSVSVQQVSVISATSLSATVAVPSSAPLQANNVVVHAGTQTYRAALGITVAVNDQSQTGVSLPPSENTLPLNAQIVIQFSKPINRNTLLNISIQDSNGLVPARLLADVSGRFATILPERLLAAGGGVSISVGGVTDAFGNLVRGAYWIGSTGYTIDESIPSVTAVSPADSESGVATNAVVSVLASETINPASAGNGITLSGPSGIVAGTFTFDGRRKYISFHPSTLLAARTVYTISYTRSLTDNAGNNIADPGMSTFTTGDAPDFSFFSAIAFNPTGLATGVPLNAPVRFLFNRPIDRASVSVNLTDGSGSPLPIQWRVESDDHTVTITPTAPLRPNVSYSASIDACGETGDCRSYSIHFISGTAIDVAAPRIISASPPNHSQQIPSNARISVRLSEAVDATSLGATVRLSPPVPGTESLEFSGTVLTFLPSQALAAGTVYSVTITGLRDPAGNVMASTPAGSFTTSSSGVILNGNPSLVSSSPPNLGSLPVTSPIVMNFSAPIDGTRILPANPTVLVNGNPLAGTFALTGARQVTFTPVSPYPADSTVAVSLTVFDVAGYWGTAKLAFTAAHTPDIEPVRLLSVSPSNGASGVLPSTPVVLTFSKSINPNTVLGLGGVAIFDGAKLAGFQMTMSSDNRTVSLVAGSDLTSTIRTVVAGPGVTDLSGNSLVPFQSTYTLVDTSNSADPHVTLQIPSAGSGLPLDTPTITLFTSAPMDATTLPGAVTLVQGGIVVPATVTLPQPQTIVIQPAASFRGSQLVTLLVSSSATDTAGHRLVSYLGSFWTLSNPSNTPATLVRTSPVTYTHLAPVNTVVDLQYSKALDPATVNSSTASLTLNGNPVPVTLGLRNGSTTIRMSPTVALAPYKEYLAAVSGVVDSNGLPIPPVSFSFSTSADGAGPPPTVLGISPSHTRGIGTNASVRVSFSGPINPASVTSSTIRLASQSGFIAPADLWFDATNETVTLAPTVALPADSVIKITLDGVEDAAGQAVTAQSVTFATGAAPDLAAPELVSTNIPYSAQNIPLNTSITYQFSEPIDRRPLLAQGTLLTDQFLQPVPGSFAFSADGMSFIFTPGAALQPFTGYGVNLSSIQDLAGNPVYRIDNYFATGGSPDATPPVIMISNPAVGSSAMPTNVRLEVGFNEPVSLVNLSHVVLRRGATVVPVTVTPDPTLGPTALVVTPTTLLTRGAAYTLAVAVADITGNWMALQSFPFTTGDLPQLAAGQIVAQNPAQSAVGVPVTVQPSITLNVPLNPVSLMNPAAVSLARSSSCGFDIVPATATPSFDNTTVTISPLLPLTPATQYSLCSSVTDIAGNTVYLQSWFVTAP